MTDLKKKKMKIQGVAQTENYRFLFFRFFLKNFVLVFFSF
jgi:hypothetical protein